MAQALLDTVLGKLAPKNEEGEKLPAYEILETYKGKELEYKEYEPLYACAKEVADKQRKKCFHVVCDEYVTLTDGTGVVHIAPAFGEDDAKVGRKYDFPFVQLVTEKGEMAESTPFAGLFVKKADPVILKDLEERGLLFEAPNFEHSYPHCWRCDTPLIYYARESWFIKMTDVKEDLIAKIIQSTGFQKVSVRDVSATGLKTYRTGVSAVTVTGELHSTSGNVNADTSILSEALKN
jgi:isoleucyl-tRNA synthetase